MLGPLQLTVVGFDEDKYARDIILEIKNLRKSKTIRLFDLLYLFKHPDGTFEGKEVSDLAAEEQREFGSVIKTLIGLSAGDMEHVGADDVAETLENMDSGFGLSDSELQAVADQMPNDSSAIFVLFEHAWARGVKQAMINAGGTLHTQGMLDPDTLKVATNELATVLEAIDKSEMAAMEQMAEVITGAKVEEEEARVKKVEAEAEAEAAATLAAAAVAEAIAVSDQVDQSVTEARAREEEALRRAEEVKAEAQAQEDAAFAEVEAVRQAAQRQVEQAEAMAAEAVQRAEEIEAEAVLRAVNALVAARVIQRSAAREALEAIVDADVIEVSAARRAAKNLSASA
ncbi:MAG TPA: hypothetical protein VLE70_21015 [Anaerolineae bacterium]|jgi:uncharacterized membrane protein|nr:hypothetical protein [Anaerolineae bacterium]